jgi:hypothetical protein
VFGRSAAFDDQVRNGGVVTFRCDVYRAGVLLASDLQITGGSVTVDAKSAIRRRCSFQVIDPTGVLIPSSSTSTLAPYGNEAVLHRGYGSELLPLGTFRIESADVVDDGAQIVSVTGFDRASTIAEARLETPYVVAEGVNYATAIRDLIASRYAGLSYTFATTTRVTPSLVFGEGSDPWQAAQQMASNLGMEVFFGVDGGCVLRPEPTGVGEPVTWTYTDDSQSTIIMVSNQLRAKPSYNGAIVSGENTDLPVPVRAEAFDLDPASPTYYYGPYGRRPIFFKSQFVTSQAQAQDAANGLLQKELGGTEQLELSIIPHPAHEAGDLIRAVKTTVSVDDFCLIQALEVPLAVSGTMRILTKARRSGQ